MNHLEGKVDAQFRVSGRPETVPWNDGTQSRPGQRTGMSRASNMNVAPDINKNQEQLENNSATRKSAKAPSKENKSNHLVMGSTIHSNTRFS